MTIVLDYEELKADFNHKLMTQLRGHSSGNDYLETWVPDDNPVKSILNMVEAAISGGLNEMSIRFTSATMNEGQRKELLTEITKLARASLATNGEFCELTVSEIKA